MLTDELYVCDADCLISLHRRFGRAAIRSLRRLAKTGRFKLPEGVIHELDRGSGNLKRFTEKETPSIRVEARSNLQLRNEIARIDRQYGETIVFGQHCYGGFWKSKGGRQAADAQVVAAAKTLQAEAVPDDRAVKLACALEGVSRIGSSEFTGRLGLIRPQQLNLNLDDTEGGV